MNILQRKNKSSHKYHYNIQKQVIGYSRNRVVRYLSAVQPDRLEYRGMQPCSQPEKMSSDSTIKRTTLLPLPAEDEQLPINMSISKTICENAGHAKGLSVVYPVVVRTDTAWNIPLEILSAAVVPSKLKLNDRKSSRDASRIIIQ